MFWIAWSKLWNGQRGSKRHFVVNLLGNIPQYFQNIPKKLADNWILQNWHWSLWRRFGILGLQWAIQQLWGAREIDDSYAHQISQIPFEIFKYWCSTKPKLSNHLISPITAIVKIHRKRRSRTIATYLIIYLSFS